MLVRANVANPTHDVEWGAPGTLLAALAMGEWTGEPRWEEAVRESAAALRARRGDDGLYADTNAADVRATDVQGLPGPAAPW